MVVGRQAAQSLLHPEAILVAATLLSPPQLQPQELVQAVHVGSRWCLSPLA